MAAGAPSRMSRLRAVGMKERSVASSVAIPSSIVNRRMFIVSLAA